MRDTGHILSPAKEKINYRLHKSGTELYKWLNGCCLIVLAPALIPVSCHEILRATWLKQ